MLIRPKNNYMNNPERDKKIIEHDVLIKEVRQDISEIKLLLSNHITTMMDKVDKYKTLFIGVLITLVFTLIGVIINIIVQIK